MNVSRKVFINRQRLKNALKLKGISVPELSRQIGVPYDTLRYCIQREKIMPDILEEICKYLDVSSLYIQGKLTDPACDPVQYEKQLRDVTFTEFTDEEISSAVEEYTKRIDPDGNRIPLFAETSIHEYMEERKEKEKAEKEMLINYLVSNFADVPSIMIPDCDRDQFDRSYFENHFNHLKDLIDSTILSFLIMHHGE